MNTVKDPVCNVTVDEKTAQFKSLYAYNVYYFHSAACKDEFDKDPEKYVQKDGTARHASHYGGYCPTPGCGAPVKGLAWYFYVGLLLLLLLITFIFFAL